MTISENRLTQKEKVAHALTAAGKQRVFPSFGAHLHDARNLCFCNEDCTHEYYQGGYISVAQMAIRGNRNNAALRLNYTAPAVLLWFQRSGNVEIRAGGENISFSGTECNLLRLLEGEIHISYNGANSKAIALYFAVESFLKLLPVKGSVAERMKTLVSGTKPSKAHQHHFPIRWEIERSLNAMTDGIRTGQRYSSMTVLSEGIQLLSQFFRQLEVADQGLCRFQKLQDDKMIQVRHLLEGNLEEPLSIAELAHHIGTNETYLKKQFKENFGTTIHGYLLRYRMEKAVELLKEGHPVYDVAWKVGYKHATHFTQAFKKHFGFPPGKWK